MNRNSMLKTAGAALALAAIAVPGLASAQSYDYRQGQSYGGYGYDQSYNGDYRQCDARDRQATGAVLGAAIGAIAGSQVSARGRRTENSVLGGILGAVVGAGVGGDSANCYGQADRYDQRAYGQYGYDQRGYDQRAYDQRDYAYQGYEQHDRYDDRRYDDRAYGQAYGYDRNGCRTVETRERDRYGRVVTRYQEVCRQSY
jgi:outer membrane lipoprotein SlyB